MKEVDILRKTYIWTCAAALWLLSAVTVPAQTLSSGMSGGSVEELQNQLVDAGYFARTVDGEYGSSTAKAVALFQKDHGLRVTGIADEATVRSIRKSIGDGYRKGGGVVLAEGNRGGDVAECQQALVAAGFLDTADGTYGPATTKAVTAYQKDRGLPVSGVIDEETYGALTAEKGAPAPAAPREKSTGDRGGSKGTVRLGDRGDQVVRLQNLLALHGFAPDMVDGVFGSGTEEKLKEFQNYHGMKADGVAGGKVWEKLESAPVFFGDYKQVIRMQSTAYTPYDGGGTGRTATGNIAGKGHAAVDPSVIPLGSILFIEDYGYAIADDIGGGINGRVVDVGVDTLEQAYRWGSRRVNVYIVK